MFIDPNGMSAAAAKIMNESLSSSEKVKNQTFVEEQNLEGIAHVLDQIVDYLGQVAANSDAKVEKILRKAQSSAEQAHKSVKSVA